MFQGWDSFYLLIGGAAGALIGLLFVVETLTAGVERDKALIGASVYVTPCVFHFAVVLGVSAVALAPRLADWLEGLAVAAAALAGLIYSVRVALGIRSGKLETPPHWSDFWYYGVAAAGVYLALGAAALSSACGWPFGPDAVAAVTVALLLLSVRNAWDLVTWLAPGAKVG
jgi:hypothetical protein